MALPPRSRVKVVNYEAEGTAEGKPSNSFSKASFVATNNDGEGGAVVDVNDPEFWTKCVGLTVPVEQEEQLGRRAARGGRKDYTDKAWSESEGGASDDEDFNAELEDLSSGDDSDQGRSRTLQDRQLWSHNDLTEVLGALLMFGYGRWEDIRTHASVTSRGAGDVATVCRAMIAVMLHMEAVQQAQLALKREREENIVRQLILIADKEKPAVTAADPPAAAHGGAHAAAAAAVKDNGNGDASTAPVADVGGAAGGGGGGSVSNDGKASPPPAAGVHGAVATGGEANSAAGSGSGSSSSGAAAVAGGGVSAATRHAATLASATPAARKAAEAAVPPASEARAQLAVAKALESLLGRHPSASRAVQDMRRVMAESAVASASRKDSAAAAAASASLQTQAAQQPPHQQQQQQQGPQVALDVPPLPPAKKTNEGEKAGAAGGKDGAEVTGASEVSATASPEASLEASGAANVSSASSSAGGHGAEASRGKSSGPDGAAGSDVTPNEVVAGAMVAAAAAAAGQAAAAAAVAASTAAEAGPGSTAAPPGTGEGSAAGVGSGREADAGAPALVMEVPAATAAAAGPNGTVVAKEGASATPVAANGAGASAAAAAKTAVPAAEQVDTMTILRQVWKPKNMAQGTKFRAALVRISAKLSTLDEIDDLARLITSADPPYGRYLNQVPEGWGAPHDKWLAQSAHEQGWFTAAQKRRANKLMEDPSKTWPGLIKMPDHVVMGRRLKQLVAKFRAEAAKNALLAKKAAKEKADAAARYKKHLADMERNKVKRELEERQRREWQAKLAKREEARAEHNRLLAAAQQAAKEKNLRAAHADAARQRDIDVTARAAGIPVAAAAGLREAANLNNPASSLATEILKAQRKQLQLQQQQQQQQQQDQPALLPALPEGLDPSSPNVSIVHGPDGRILGYRVWSSPAVRKAAAVADMVESGRRLFSQATPAYGGAAGGLARVVPAAARLAANGGVSSSSNGEVGAAGLGLGLDAQGVASVATLTARSLSIAEAGAASDDGIMLRHAVHNLGVPISMLLNHISTSAAAAGGDVPSLSPPTAAYSALHAVLEMSWIRLANGNGLNAKGAESIGVVLLSKAAAICGDNHGLRLPHYGSVVSVSAAEKTTLESMLVSAARATQLRASLLAYTELKEIQSFAARLARARELKAMSMPSWYRPIVYDAHLLLASCIYGSSSDYGVAKAMKETTYEMLRENVIAFARQEEFARGGGGGDPAADADTLASLAAACKTAEGMAPIAAMTNPPLTPAAAKLRIKTLQAVAFVAARRLLPPALAHHPLHHRAVAAAVAVGSVNGEGGGRATGRGSGNSGSTEDDCVVVSANGSDGGSVRQQQQQQQQQQPLATRTGAAALASTTAMMATAVPSLSPLPSSASAGTSPSKVAATTSTTSSVATMTTQAAATGASEGATTAAVKTGVLPAKRPSLQVVVLDVSEDEQNPGEGGGGGGGAEMTSESPAKKARVDLQKESAAAAPLPPQAPAAPAPPAVGAGGGGSAAGASVDQGERMKQMSGDGEVPPVPPVPPAALAAGSSSVVAEAEGAEATLVGKKSGGAADSAAAAVAKEAMPLRKKGVTLDSFWNSL